MKFIFDNIFFTKNQDFFSILKPCNEKMSKTFFTLFSVSSIKNAKPIKRRDINETE